MSKKKKTTTANVQHQQKQTHHWLLYSAPTAFDHIHSTTYSPYSRYSVFPIPFHSPPYTNMPYRSGCVPVFNHRCVCHPFVVCWPLLVPVPCACAHVHGRVFISARLISSSCSSSIHKTVRSFGKEHPRAAAVHHFTPRNSLR